MSKKNKQPQKSAERREQPLQAVNVPKEAATPKKEPSGASAFFNAMKGKEVYLLLGALILACFFIFLDFIDGEKVFLYKDIGSDSINIFFPYLAHASDYMKQNGWQTWTFGQGMGQNMFPLSFGDYFSNFITLFDKSKIPYMIGHMEVIKVILCGFFFHKYLLELKVQQFAAGVGALMYAFSGFVMIGTCWTIFSLEALYVSIMLYGFERWMHHGKWLWFVVGITSIGFVQPFFLFMYTIFLMFYIPLRYNDEHEGADWKKFPMFVAKTVGLAALAVFVTSWQLFPDLLQYIESPRVGGAATLITRLKAQPMFGFSDELLRFTTTYRAFSSDMLGTGNEFQGWQNYLEAPVFYCGVLGLVAFPQVFIGLNKMQRIGWSIFVGCFALPIFFPYFRYAFWAFTGDYFRTYSGIVILIMVLCTAKALHQIITDGKLNKWVLGATVLILLGLLYTPASNFEPAINKDLRSFETVLLVVYAALLFALTMKSNIRNLAMIGIASLCFLELVYNGSNTINKRDIMTSEDVKDRIGYNDYSVDAVNFIKSADKGFFRLEKDYRSGLAMHASTNDNQVQGYFGTQSYFSFNQKNYIKFLSDLNIIDPTNELDTRWARGLIQRPLLFSIAGGKYYLSKQPQNYLVQFGYDSINTFGNVKVFRNKYALPLGFAYDSYVTDAEFKRLGNVQKDIGLFKYCVLEDKDVALLPADHHANANDTVTQFTFDLIGQLVSQRRQDTLRITGFKESHIVGEIAPATPKLLFLSIPYDEGWHATINGAPAQLYRINCGLMGIKIPSGKSTVDLNFEPRLMKTGGMISMAVLVLLVGIGVLSLIRKGKSEA